MSAVSGLVRVMERAARKAGTRLRRDFGEVEHLQVSRKGPADFVSKADQAAERTIWDELRAARPGWRSRAAGRRIIAACAHHRRTGSLAAYVFVERATVGVPRSRRPRLLRELLHLD